MVQYWKILVLVYYTQLKGCRNSQREEGVWDFQEKLTATTETGWGWLGYTEEGAEHK